MDSGLCSVALSVCAWTVSLQIHLQLKRSPILISGPAAHGRVRVVRAQRPVVDKREPDCRLGEACVQRAAPPSPGAGVPPGWLARECHRPWRLDSCSGCTARPWAAVSRRSCCRQEDREVSRWRFSRSLLHRRSTVREDDTSGGAEYQKQSCCP